MNPTLSAPASTIWYRVRCEQRHRRAEHPLLWILGWAAKVASGLGAIAILHRADDHGRVLLAMLSLLGGITMLSALHVLGTMLSADTSRLLLPLPLTPASRWRLMMLETFFAASGPAIAILIATALTTSWQWTVMMACWIPVACTVGASIACTFSWSLSGVRVRWRALVLSLVAMLATGASLVMMATAPRQLSPLMLLPDALIVIGLSLGPGTGLVGRVMPPILRQVATTPPTSFAFFPHLTIRLAEVLERHPNPAFAIVRKDLLTHSRETFILIRVALVVGALPLAILLEPRFGNLPPGARIAIPVIILACYGMVELSPSPFGGEGNRLLLALQTDTTSSSLLLGKVLGLLLFNLPQTWISVTIVSIGTGAGLLAGLFAIATTSVTVTGLSIILTSASTWDIDLERRIDDRTQALLAEHMPIGVRRMLGLGVAGLVAVGSIAILLRTSSGIALPLLFLLHVVGATVTGKIGLLLLAGKRGHDGHH